MAHENILTTKKLHAQNSPVFMDSWLPSVYKEVWEAADAEEIPHERAIAHDGKLPVKDPFVSGSLFAGLK